MRASPRWQGGGTRRQMSLAVRLTDERVLDGATRSRAVRVRATGQQARVVGWLTLACLALAAVAALALPARPAQAQALASGAPHVDTLTFERDVDPGSARFLEDAISTAEQDGATALVITLDTPGGDIASMEQMVQRELASTVPIIVYVAPQGAHAGSAGTFVTLAAVVVAMAPNTRIGAASPVDSAGQDISSTLDRKIKNDLEALIRRMQTTYGRNADLAVQTVESAASFDDQQAIAQRLVNLGAPTRDDLLRQLDGTSVTLATGTQVTLHTAGLPLNEISPTLANHLEDFFLDPTVLFIIFIVAAVCIYLEMSHPGAIVPGTVGVIALVIFLFGAGSLDPNWAGLVLMLLAIVLLAVDVRAPTHGVLTLGALISLVLGSLIFFDSHTGEGAPGVSPIVIGATAVGVGLISLVVISYAVRSQRWRVTTGGEGLLGQMATVTVALEPKGRVRIMGEDWAARLSKDALAQQMTVAPDGRVRVTGRDGLTLIVEPLPAKQA